MFARWKYEARTWRALGHSLDALVCTCVGLGLERIVARLVAAEARLRSRVRSRQVSWTGNSTGGGARYGRLWIPSVDPRVAEPNYVQAAWDARHPDEPARSDNPTEAQS